MMQTGFTISAEIGLSSPEATTSLAEAIAPALVAGDVVLLEGPIGAGKSHFCRAVIACLLGLEGRSEDIPSPTYTLVQTYRLARFEIWHADLYRLTGPSQVIELGLEDAFDTALVLVEWPDRLGDAAPPQALRIELAPTDAGDGRIARVSASDPRWRKLADVLDSFVKAAAGA